MLAERLTDGKKHIVSLVGAGGKTTIMYELASLLAARGLKVLATTSTRIMRPDPRLLAGCCRSALKLWARGSYAVAGRPADGGKLSLPDGLPQLMELADITLVEADGAKGRPCKAPAAHEPVILPESDIVVGVMGLDALGRSLRDGCFRTKAVCALLGKNGEDLLTEEDAALLLSSGSGALKGVGSREFFVVLNKCDDAAGLRQARKIRELLAEGGMDRDHIIIRGKEAGWYAQPR